MKPNWYITDSDAAVRTLRIHNFQVMFVGLDRSGKPWWMVDEVANYTSTDLINTANAILADQHNSEDANV